MTNIDSLLKNRDITLPRKVHLVKTKIFPVVMYGCESWTIKKAEGEPGADGAARGALSGSPLPLPQKKKKRKKES